MGIPPSSGFWRVPADAGLGPSEPAKAYKRVSRFEEIFHMAAKCPIADVARSGLRAHAQEPTGRRAEV